MAKELSNTAEAELLKPRLGDPVDNTIKQLDTITTANSIQSPLLCVPGEVRNQIYKLVVYPDALHVHAHKGTNYRSRVRLCKATIRNDEAAVAISTSEQSTRDENYYVCHRSCARNPVSGSRGEKLSLSLLVTCHQVHDEAALVLFQNCNFAFSHLGSIPVFLDRLSAGQQHSIRKIIIEPFDYHQLRTFLNIKRMTGLKEVMVFAEHNCGYHPQAVNTTDLREARHKLNGVTRLFSSHNLSKATVCLTHDGPRTDECLIPQTQSSMLCEELEAKLLEPPVAGVEEEEEGVLEGFFAMALE